MSEDWYRLRGWRLWAAAFVLLTGGFLNDPPWKGYRAENQFAPYGEVARVATNLFRDGRFADPFATLPTGPTGHVAPGYPFLQSLLLGTFGDGAGGWLAIRALGTAAQNAQYALLPWIARTLGFSPWTGVIGGVLGIVVKAPREEMWEGQFAGLLILLLTAAMHRGQSWNSVLAGITFLVQPVTAGTYFVWAAWRRQWKWIAVPLVICAPWLVRTAIATGGPGWMRSNLGLEMAMSFNDCTPYGVRLSEMLGCSQSKHPNAVAEEAAKIRDIGEYRYSRERLRDALGWILEHPARSAELIGQRAWFFWFPSDFGVRGYAEQRKRFMILHALTALSFVGLAVAWRRVPGARLLGLWLLLLPPIYYLVQFEVRYRIPLLWITYLLAAYAIQAGCEPLSRKSER